MRRLNLLLLLLVSFAVLVPTSAQAELQLAGAGRGDRSKRIGTLETHPRRGINVAGTVKMGAVGMVNTFIPVVRASYEVGGGITDRFTLGLLVGGTAYLGLDKGSFNLDVVGRRFFGKGLFFRGAFGVSSHVPTLAAVPLAPAIGGSAGLGYEFRLFKRVGMAVGADYDLRLRTDARMGHAVFFGLRFTGYLDKKNR